MNPPSSIRDPSGAISPGGGSFGPAGLRNVWLDGRDLVVIDDQGHVTRTPARWGFYLVGCDHRDVQALSRLAEVSGVIPDGPNRHWVECLSHADRKAVVDILEDRVGRDPILEADVGPVRRFLTDHPEVHLSERMRLGWFDLETDSRCTFEQARNGLARVLCWSVVDEEGVATATLEEDTDVAERRLLRGLFERFRGSDILLAWNGEGFDFPVLAGRLGALGMRIPWARWRWLDALEVHRKYHVGGAGDEKTSMRLEDVAQAQLGRGKHDFDASKTWESWAEGGAERERMARYCEADAELMPAIEGATGYVAMHLAVCRLTRCFPDTWSLRATEQGDGFLMSLGAKQGHRWPTRWRTEDPDKFAGAWVMDPTRTGIIEDVHVADFAGLYPSIMRSWNMSPETLDPLGTSRMPTTEARFSADRPGLVPMALDQLVAERAKTQKLQGEAQPGSGEWERLKHLSAAMKIVANSFYGIVGSPYSRFYSRDVAEGVTTTGRWLLEHVIREAKEAGLDPFYGDTDSVFVAGPWEDMRQVVDSCNATWGQMLADLGAPVCRVKLELEKSFRRLVLVRKKRYAAALSRYKGRAAKAGAREIKGLELQRGDSARMARELQEEVVTLLLAEGEPSLKEARALVAQWHDRVLEGVLDLPHVILSQALSKPLRTYAAAPPHVRVARLMQSRGEDVLPGTRIRYVMVRGPDGPEPVPATDPLVLERADRAFYWRKRVFPAARRVLEAAFPGELWDEEARPVVRGLEDLPLFSPRGTPLRVRAVAGDDSQMRVYRAVRALAEAHEGGRELILEVSVPAHRHLVTLPTGLGVDGSEDLLQGLVRLGLEVTDG